MLPQPSPLLGCGNMINRKC